MAVTPTTITPHPPRVRPGDAPGVGQRGLGLVEALGAVECALASPPDDPAWCTDVAERVADLRHAFAHHVTATEGPSGSYAEVLTTAPRLTRAVELLVQEHDVLRPTLDLVSRALDGAVDESASRELRTQVTTAVRAVARHRERGAKLVYDAYATDIGGET